MSVWVATAGSHQVIASENGEDITFQYDTGPTCRRLREDISDNIPRIIIKISYSSPADNPL